MQGQVLFVRCFLCLCLLQFLLAFAYATLCLKRRLTRAGFKRGVLEPLLAWVRPREPSAMDLQVKAILRQKRIERLVFASHIMLGPFCVVLALNMFLLNMHHSFLSEVELDLAMIFGRSGVWTLFYALTGSLMIVLLPRARNHSIVSLLHGFLFASTSFTIFFNNTEDTYYFAYAWIAIAHLFMNMIDGEMWLVVCVNAGFAVVSFCTALAYLPNRTLLGCVTYEFMIFCLNSGATLLVVSSRAAMLRATLECKMSRNFRSAGASLLSSVCDVVVHLNSDLEIVDPSPQLAAFLLKPTSKNAMQGLPFIELLQDAEDKTRFLETTARSDHLTQVMHTSFRDANNTILKVHLYHTTSVDVDDQPFHMIGIQEDDPVLRFSNASQNEVSVVNNFNWGVSPLSIAHCDELSLNSSDIAVSELPTEETEGISVWFDASSNGMEVLKCTPSFIYTCGPAYAKRPLLSCLRPVHEAKFMAWMQHALNRACHDLPVQEKSFRFALPQQVARLSALLVLDTSVGRENSGLRSTDDSMSEQAINAAKLTLSDWRHGRRAEETTTPNLDAAIPLSFSLPPDLVAPTTFGNTTPCTTGESVLASL